MRIAAEGISTVIAGLILCFLSWILFALFPQITIYPGLLFTVLSGGSLFFFREPIIEVTAGEDLILAPADGRVLPFSEYRAEDGSKLIMVSIFLSIFDVHVNRSAVTGMVEEVEYKPGKFHFAFRREAALVNEMNRITTDCKSGRVIMQQVAGAVARRVICHLQKGQSVSAGDRIGIIKFGSRMDLILPENIDIKVKPGDTVRSGRTIMGVWIDGQ